MKKFLHFISSKIGQPVARLPITDSCVRCSRTRLFRTAQCRTVDTVDFPNVGIFTYTKLFCYKACNTALLLLIRIIELFTSVDVRSFTPTITTCCTIITFVTRVIWVAISDWGFEVFGFDNRCFHFVSFLVW